MMRRRTFAAACVVCVLTLLAPADGQSEQPPELQALFGQLDTNGDGRLTADEIPAGQAALFSRLLRTADENGDHQLSAAEFDQGLESKRIARPIPPKRDGRLEGADALLLLVARMDANSDRTIVAEEVPAELREFFDRVQSQVGGKADGRITRREIIQAAPRLGQMAQRFARQQDWDVEVEIALLPDRQWAMVERLAGPNRPGASIFDPKQAQEAFARLDADGDGRVTPEEVPEAFADRFEQLLQRTDQNEDGQLSRKELLRFSQRLADYGKNRPQRAEIGRRLSKLFRKFDSNGDKLLDREEAPRPLAARFDRVDTSGDGTLDRKELLHAVELLNRLRIPEADGSSAGKTE